MSNLREGHRVQLSKLFLLEVDSGNRELGSQFTEHQQGSSSALLRAEGENEALSPCLRQPACRHVP